MSATDIIDNPFAVFVIAVVTQAGAAFIGDRLRRKRQPLKKDEQNDLDTVLTATLTLLALIIGFSFSMAVSRYDQRKNYEEAEANAIGTEYIRADLLPAEDAAKVRELLKSYVDQRIAFYNRDRTASASAEAARVRGELWSSVARVASAQPNPVVGLGLSGMNDVFNTQADTQAAWLNRIPIAAWGINAADSVFLKPLIGLSGAQQRASRSGGTAGDLIHRVLS